MALTRITQAPQQALATPSYDALYQGVAQGEAYKTAGARFKADSIKEGLQNFEKNQQLLAKHMGIFQGAISSNPEFKNAIEDLDPKSDLGRAVQEASRGNASLTSMLALSNFATEYGAGEAAQQQMALQQQTIESNQYALDAAAEVNNANEFLDSLIDAKTNMISPADINEGLQRLKDSGAVIGDGFRTALANALEQRQSIGQIKQPLLQPNISPVYKIPDDSTSPLVGYVVADRNGRPVTTIDLYNKAYNYNSIAQLRESNKLLDAMEKEKNPDGTPKFDPVEIEALRRGVIKKITQSASSNNVVGQAFNIVRTEFGLTPYLDGKKPNPAFWNEVTRIIKLKLKGEKPTKEDAKLTLEEFSTNLMIEFGYEPSEVDQVVNDATRSYVEASQGSDWK